MKRSRKRFSSVAKIIRNKDGKAVVANVSHNISDDVKDNVINNATNNIAGSAEKKWWDSLCGKCRNVR